MENNLKVGDKLYYIVYNRYTKSKEIEFDKVSKITTKYIISDQGNKINKDTLKYEDKMYCQHNIQYYTSEERASEKITKDSLISQIQKKLNFFNFDNLNLVDLNTIYNIIK